MSQDAVCWVNLEKHKLKDYSSGRPDLTLSSLMTQYMLVTLEKRWVQDRTRLCIKYICMSPHPQSVLLKAWQVQHDKEVQQQSSIEEACAEGDTFKIDCRVQGAPQSAVLEDQGRMTKIQNLVHTLRTQSRRKSVITDHKKTGEFNMLSEESKKIVQSLGKSEVFELGEVSTNIQCPPCVKYHPQELLHSSWWKWLRPSKKSKNARRRNNLTYCQYLATLCKGIFLVVQNIEDLKKNNVIYKRMKEIIFVYSGEISEGWTVQKFPDRHRMDQKTLQVLAFAHIHWFLVYSYAERASAIWKQRYSWH